MAKMSLAVSSSPPHLGQVSVDMNNIGILSALAPDMARKLAVQALDGPRVANRGMVAKKDVSQNDTLRSVDNVKLTGSPTPVAIGNSAEMAPSGACSKIRTEDGVAEFRGPTVHGLVRFAQVSEHESQIEASFDGLTPGPHSWSVNEYGDVREGAASTGRPYSPVPMLAQPQGKDEMIPGLLGTLTADSTGHVQHTFRSSRLAVWDIIGRSVVLYRSCHQELQNTTDAIACAVIARSSVPGPGGARQLCRCDGTVIWQSSN